MIVTPALSLDEFVEESGDGRGDQADELFGETVWYMRPPPAWRDPTLLASTPGWSFYQN
jgi:hypothetical protein